MITYMCVTVYVQDAEQADGLYIAPTSSTLLPIGVGLMDWDEDGVRVPSSDDSRALSVEGAILLRDQLTRAITAEQADPGRMTRAATERNRVLAAV